MAIDPINFARTTQVRLRRGTTAQIAANPPVEAEPFYDLTSQRMGVGGGSDGIVEQWKSQFLEHTADAAGAVPMNMQEKLDEILSVKNFGAVGDGVTDDTAAFQKAFSSSKIILIPGGNGESYRISKYPRVDGIQVIGLGLPEILLFFNDTPVMVQFGSNSQHDGIIFRSSEVDLELQRASIENCENVIISSCGFFDFKHNSSSPNAWGIYMKYSSNCKLINCYFGGNSQSDIAIVDECRNIMIFHPVNDVDADGVYLNVEPSTPDGVRGLNVIGGKYRVVSLLENQNTGYASRSIKFVGSEIKNLIYDGPEAHFDDGCKIGSITNENNATVFSGNLNVSLGISRNIVDDPYLIDLAQSNPSGEWSGNYISISWGVDRVRDEFGTYVRLNKNSITQGHSIKSKKIFLDSGDCPLLFMQIGRSVIPNGDGRVGNRTAVEYYDSGNSKLGESRIITCRGTTGTTTEMMSHFAILEPPENTEYVIIYLSAPISSSAICDHVMAVGLWEISDSQRLTNTREIASRMSSIESILSKSTQSPSTANHVGGFSGDRAINLNPTVGQPKAWICTVSGTPGTWVSEGDL